MNSPCFGCEKRIVGCHSNCLYYISYKNKLDAIREKERKLRDDFRPTHSRSSLKRSEEAK